MDTNDNYITFPENRFPFNTWGRGSDYGIRAPVRYPERSFGDAYQETRLTTALARIEELEKELGSAQKKIEELKKYKKEVIEWKDKCLALVFHPDGEYAKSVINTETNPDKE
jgi:hypothetical protein